MEKNKIYYTCEVKGAIFPQWEKMVSLPSIFACRDFIKYQDSYHELDWRIIRNEVISIMPAKNRKRIK